MQQHLLVAVLANAAPHLRADRLVRPLSLRVTPRFRPHVAHVENGVAVVAAALLLLLLARDVVLHHLARLVRTVHVRLRVTAPLRTNQCERRDDPVLGPVLRLLDPVAVVHHELVAAPDARQRVGHQHRQLHVGVLVGHVAHVLVQQAGVVVRAPGDEGLVPTRESGEAAPQAVCDLAREDGVDADERGQLVVGEVSEHGSEERRVVEVHQDEGELVRHLLVARGAVD